MTIHNEKRFIQSLPDWAMLDGCFGPTIKPSDIDGWVERNGQCLFLEHKRAGVPMTKGQNRGFRALAAQGNEVIVFWGDARDGTDMTHMLVHRAGTEASKVEATLADLRAEASRWYQEADQAPPPVAAARRRDQRAHPQVCVCGETRVRLWPVPAVWQVNFGETIWYCAECEPFEGGPVSDWSEASLSA